MPPEARRTRFLLDLAFTRAWRRVQLGEPPPPLPQPLGRSPLVARGGDERGLICGNMWPFAPSAGLAHLDGHFRPFLRPPFAYPPPVNS
jgi:hypothetical protein